MRHCENNVFVVEFVLKLRLTTSLDTIDNALQLQEKTQESLQKLYQKTINELTLEFVTNQRQLAASSS